MKLHTTLHCFLTLVRRIALFYKISVKFASSPHGLGMGLYRGGPTIHTVVYAVQILSFSGPELRLLTFM
jgi:hypothetical protein